MSTLTSSSTLVEIENAYVDNASYEEDASVAKAKAFITAARILLLKLPEESGTRESHLKLSKAEIAAQLEQARTWVAANDTGDSGSSGPRVTLGSFEAFR